MRQVITARPPQTVRILRLRVTADQAFLSTFILVFTIGLAALAIAAALLFTGNL